MNFPDDATDFVILDDSGVPSAAINVEQIRADVMSLVWHLAATAGDEDATDRVMTGFVDGHDVDYAGCVTTAALSVLVADVLAPAFAVCRAAGHDLQAALADLAP